MENKELNSLISKLDAFIKKYYKNQLLKGSILSLGLIGVYFLIISLLEYYGNFGTIIRTFFFYSFLLFSGIVFINFIGIPVFKLFNIGKRISYAQAAQIIGLHFVDIKDKLLNILQLNEFSKQNTDNSLVLAGIEQKTLELKPFYFPKAINLSENIKYLRFGIPPLFIILFLAFVYPEIIKDSTKRIVSHGTYFEPQAPFSYSIPNIIEVGEGDDFLLDINLNGSTLPTEVEITYNDLSFKTKKETNSHYSYLFKSIKSDINFQLKAAGFTSKPYQIKVISKALFSNISLTLDYPAYLNLKKEEINNRNNLLVPRGTKITWNIQTKNTNQILFHFKDSIYSVNVNSNQYQFSNKILSNFDFSLLLKNNTSILGDSLSYTIQEIPDLFPVINVNEIQDSVFFTRLYFSGDIKDDYGLTKLIFYYKNTKDEEYTAVPLNILKNQNEQRFYHVFDAKTSIVSDDDKVEYYFEVWDNDGVNGNKASRSAKKVFDIPTKQDIQKQIENQNNEIKNDIAQNQQLSQQIDKDINKLSEDILKKQQLQWQDKKKMEEIIQKQKDFLQQFDEIKEQNKQNNLQKNMLNEQEQRILDKQQKLEELLNNTENKEIQKLLEKMEKMMQQMNKEQMQDMLDKMKLTNEDLEKSLERTMELFKQLEFDQKLYDISKNLEDLQKKQLELNKELEKNANDKSLKEQQDKLNKEFDDIKKDIQSLDKLNEDLENKRDIENTDQLQKDIEQNMQNASQQMQENKNNKAGQSQKNAADKMEELQKQMNQMMDDQEAEQNEENMEDLRQLLDNTLKLSFDQERVMQQLKQTSPSSPQYKILTQTQNKLKDDSKVIEDSLLALSKRMVELKSFVNKEIADVKNNMNKAIYQMAERNSGTAVVNQQYAMTALNNLALFLSEAIEQMKEQMKQQQQKSGNQSCSKPKSGKKNPKPGMSEMQMSLQKKMEELKKKMEQGEGNKPGKPGEAKDGEMNKEFSKLAEQQAKIREQLEEMMKQMDNAQQGKARNLIKQMEQNENDLLNKRISSQTINRQKEISIKLMESEKALREQKMDDKRESNESKDDYLNKLNQQKLEEYFKNKNKEIELLKTMPANLQPYYKNKVSEYINQL